MDQFYARENVSSSMILSPRVLSTSNATLNSRAAQPRTWNALPKWVVANRDSVYPYASHEERDLNQNRGIYSRTTVLIYDPTIIYNLLNPTTK